MSGGTTWRVLLYIVVPSLIRYIREVFRACQDVLIPYEHGFTFLSAMHCFGAGRVRRFCHVMQAVP